MMLTAVFDMNELSLQDDECLSFVELLSHDIDVFLIYTGISKMYPQNIPSKYTKFPHKRVCADSIESFVIDYKEKSDWYIIFSDRVTASSSCNDNVVVCPYHFWGDLKQFEHKSFTEHARKKLLYNELSSLYIDAIANDTRLEVKFLEKIFNGSHVNKVLDCCCGVGRHTEMLGNMGFHVTGIDVSESQIEIANKNYKNKNVEYFVRDARNFLLPAEDYDAAICMWTTYNYFSQKEDLLSVMKSLYDHLADKGILILDSKNIPSLAPQRLYHRSKTKENCDIFLLVYKRIIGAIQNSQYFYFIHENGKKSFYIDEEFVRFYSLNELKDINHSLFECIDVYSDFQGNEYDEISGERMISVWRKK